MEPLILETTFLVDLEREAQRDASGPAHEFLRAHPDHRLHVTFTVAGELAAGIAPQMRNRWEDFLRPFRILWCTPEVRWRYGDAYRYLRSNGMLIGANDLWVAATAIGYGMPLVTRNERHLRRVPGLMVVGYV